MIDKEQLSDRLSRVEEKINKYARSVGRSSDEIKMVAVSKSQPLQKIEYFLDRGVRLFGENRARELRKKNRKLQETDISWHFVGHLQRNKVKYLLRMKNCVMIESLDSRRLAREIDKRAKKNDRIMPLLVQVNVGGEDSKYGIKPEDTLSFIQEVSRLENIELKGLMTLPPYKENPEEVRPFFKQLCEIKDLVQKKGFAEIKELSMGMSHDFHIAIEEGATIIRVGRALFGPREN